MPNNKPDVLFLLSVDTEEEWDWEGEFPQENFSVHNTDKLPDFQAFCENLGIRPTYFVDYAVANDAASVARMINAVTDGRCEIGAHLHPWANPPFFGYTGERESHVVNLPIEQTEAKLDALLTLLQQQFGITPRSFRTGRWGINGDVLDLLVRKGITLDSSMYPFYRNEFFDCSSTPLEPYWPDFANPQRHGNQRDILEIPASVGFNHTRYAMLYKIYEWLHQPLAYRLRIPGVFWRLHLLQKIYLSPEVTSGEDMITLLESLVKKRLPVIHMYMHSSSLIDGVNGLIEQAQACELICRRIKTAVEHLCDIANVQFCTMSEASVIIRNRLQSL